MPYSNLPHSIRKFLRREKARFRRELSDAQEAEKKIQELVAKMRAQYNRNVALRVKG